MRINRYLAAAGLGSRRKCEALVVGGKVKVGGRLLTELSYDVKDNDIVTVDGVKVRPIEKNVYLMLNKPKGYICTAADEMGRKTVLDLVADKYAGVRLFPVGRLDYDTEGLLLLTTDGDMAERLTHPRNEIEKTYIAKVEGDIKEEELTLLKNGILLDGVKTKRCKAKVLDFSKGISRVEIKISEGRNRQVRRMFESLNREVIFLKRTAVGELKLGGLYRGRYRELKEEEVTYLQNA